MAFPSPPHAGWWRRPESPHSVSRAHSRRMAPGMGPPSPAEARAQADRLLVAAERTADRQRGPVAQRTLVADRQRALATLEAHAHANAVLGVDARRAHRHVQHRRAHRALAVDATVLVGE